MADLFFPSGTPFIAYDGPSGAFAGSGATDTDTAFRETTSVDSVFDTTEPIDVIQYGYVYRTASYLGTATIGGVQYPVFRLVNVGGFSYDQTIVWGTNDNTGFPTVASLNLDTSDYPICFLAGSLIATAVGEVAVEELAIGDLVLTPDGRGVPVRWIGHQALRTWANDSKTQLVRIRAGALGKGLPHSDLTVTADHGMIIDGLVINASALVNGTTIDWVPRAELPDSFTVYHVETENHDVILANGAPSETFIDYRDRRAFDNFNEYLDLYGVERIIPEMQAPRISSARLLSPEIRTRLGLSKDCVPSLRTMPA